MINDSSHSAQDGNTGRRKNYYSEIEWKLLRFGERSRSRLGLTMHMRIPSIIVKLMRSTQYSTEYNPEMYAHLAQESLSENLWALNVKRFDSRYRSHRGVTSTMIWRTTLYSTRSRYPSLSFEWMARWTSAQLSDVTVLIAARLRRSCNVCGYGEGSDLSHFQVQVAGLRRSMLIIRRPRDKIKDDWDHKSVMTLTPPLSRYLLLWTTTYSMATHGINIRTCTVRDTATIFNVTFSILGVQLGTSAPGTSCFVSQPLRVILGEVYRLVQHSHCSTLTMNRRLIS